MLIAFKCFFVNLLSDIEDRGAALIPEMFFPLCELVGLFYLNHPQNRNNTGPLVNSKSVFMAVSFNYFNLFSFCLFA